MKNAVTKKPAGRRAKKVVLDDTPLAVAKAPTMGDLLGQLQKAIDSGQYLVAIVRQDGNQVIVDRHAVEFPKGSLDVAIKLITNDLQKLMGE